MTRMEAAVIGPLHDPPRGGVLARGQCVDRRKAADRSWCERGLMAKEQGRRIHTPSDCVPLND